MPDKKTFHPKIRKPVSEVKNEIIKKLLGDCGHNPVMASTPAHICKNPC
jgi:hypothetical protein